MMKVDFKKIVRLHKTFRQVSVNTLENLLK